MLHSDNIPSVNYSPDITKLFTYFGMNWDTLSPALWILYGVLFGFFLLGVLKHFYRD